MRGEVLFYDEARGSGFITGDDGNRYTFLASDLRQRARIAKGLRIDFRTEDDRARDIFLATGDGAAPARAAQPQARSVPEMPATATATAPPPAAPPLATAGERPDTALGVAGYFARAVTSDFANFRGRARRKEYWSFVLVVFLAYVAVAAVGLPVDAILGNRRRGADRHRHTGGTRDAGRDRSRPRRDRAPPPRHRAVGLAGASGAAALCGQPDHARLRPDAVEAAGKPLGARAGRRLSRAQAESARNFSTTASPMPVVETSRMPGDMMSLVRTPSSSTAAIAASSLSASATMPKE
jgi:cold shock CspA family protein